MANVSYISRSVCINIQLSILKSLILQGLPLTSPILIDAVLPKSPTIGLHSVIEIVTVKQNKFSFKNSLGNTKLGEKSES